MLSELSEKEKLSTKEKKLVKERLEPFVKDNSCTVDFILKALNYNRNEHHWKQTIDVIKDIDNHRNLEFKKIEQTFNNLY